jgi:spore coat protein U-like protein
MKKYTRSLAALALLASGGAFAQASPLVDNIQVSANVTAACTSLTATDVDFGPAAAADTTQDETSTISVTCDTGTAYTVEIDYGQNALGTQRQVTGAVGEYMDYDISQDAGHTMPWGTGTNGAEYIGTGSGAAQDLTAHFRLQRTLGASPGDYFDLVEVSLNF